MPMRLRRLQKRQVRAGVPWFETNFGLNRGFNASLDANPHHPGCVYIVYYGLGYFWYAQNCLRSRKRTLSNFAHMPFLGDHDDVVDKAFHL